MGCGVPQALRRGSKTPLCNSCCGEAQRVPPPSCWGSEPCVGMCRCNFFCDLCGVWARELIPQCELHL